MNYILRDNMKLGRKQAIICDGNTPVAVLETYGIETRLEGYKKHLARVMRHYVTCMDMIHSGEAVKEYNPKKVEGFAFRIDDSGRVAMLKYRDIVFAQLNMTGISSSMDTALRYIYHVAQSYIKYIGTGTR